MSTVCIAKEKQHEGPSEVRRDTVAPALELLVALGDWWLLEQPLSRLRRIF